MFHVFLRLLQRFSLQFRQLRPEDSFALILFNHAVAVVQPLKPWKDIDAVELEKK
jgi:hypothetical protein